jgi:peptidoglycan hydrolase CwlO-like protein
MKALILLKNMKEYFRSSQVLIQTQIDESKKELEDLQNENKSLVKTLEKYNEEMIDLRKENQDLKNSNNELLKGLKSTQKRLEEWLEKCK